MSVILIILFLGLICFVFRKKISMFLEQFEGAFSRWRNNHQEQSAFEQNGGNYNAVYVQPVQPIQQVYPQQNYPSSYTYPTAYNYHENYPPNYQVYSPPPVLAPNPLNSSAQASQISTNDEYRAELRGLNPYASTISNTPVGSSTLGVNPYIK